MIKKILHSLSIICLSVLLLFGATAKEFIHLFAHHEDTIHDVHHVCPPGEAHLDHEHHHCAFLSDVLLPFDNDFVAIKFAFYNKPDFAKKQSYIKVQIAHLYKPTNGLRGPPFSNHMIG